MTGTGGHSCSPRGRDTCCWLYGEQGSASVHSGNTQAAQRWGRCEPPVLQSGAPPGSGQTACGRLRGQAGRRGRGAWAPQPAPWLSPEWPQGQSPPLSDPGTHSPASRVSKAVLGLGMLASFCRETILKCSEGHPRKPGRAPQGFHKPCSPCVLPETRTAAPGARSRAAKTASSAGEGKPEASESSSSLGEKGSSPAPGRGSHSPGPCESGRAVRRGSPPRAPGQARSAPGARRQRRCGAHTHAAGRRPDTPRQLPPAWPRSGHCPAVLPALPADQPAEHMASGEHELSGAKARRAARTLKEHQGR